MANIEKICLAIINEMAVRAFLTEPIVALAGRYDVTLLLNPASADFARASGLPVRIIPVRIARDINPLADLAALYRLHRIFRRERFDVVHSVTPKVGLLCMVAARIAGVRWRIHTFTGQVWATRRGFMRTLLKAMDRVLAASATHLLADSSSQRQFLIDQRITSPARLTVLEQGSISGVNTQRYRSDRAARTHAREQVGVADDDVLLLFLGRLNRDKGVLDLAAAFARVAPNRERLRLLMVGPDEGGLTDEIMRRAAVARDRVRLLPYTDQPERYLAAADIFCLPSYREGFGSSIIEAAACGVPAIGSRIYGISDAISEGETGLLVPPGDIAALAAAIDHLAAHPQERRRMGANALARARTVFSAERLVAAWLAYYDALG